MSDNANQTAAPEVLENAIGIDLGTTYSCVGVWKNGKVEIIANDQGKFTVPSMVAFTEDDRLIGEAARNQAARNPANTVFDAKRLIGRRANEHSVVEDMKTWPFKINDVDNKPVIEVEEKGAKVTFTPEEVSAMILSHMKSIAETYLGEEVKKAVVTVPAYFNDAQRAATKDAGTIAGLEVLRIINEPTAAAIAFGLDNKASKKNVLIFDLGGGTFDVSLLTLDNGVFEVKATAGDTHLGGEDFDHNLVKHFCAEIKRKHKTDLTGNARALRRLRSACERAKRVLSNATTAVVEIDSLFDGEDFSSQISRAKFEEINMEAFKSTMVPVQKVMEDSKIDKSKIDEVVLVGGSTRIPKIQSLLKDFFEGKEPNKSINPDEAVAFGAAVQAAVITGHKDKAIADVLLLDVTPLSLGIEVEGNLMATIIKRNTTIPVEKTQQFTTTTDNQTGIDVCVFEGERAVTSANNPLGEFELKGIPPAKRGIPQIDVTFAIDSDGILNVTAKDKATGVSQSIVITNEAGRLSHTDVERMVGDAAKAAEEDRKIRELAKEKHDLEAYALEVQATFSSANVSTRLQTSELDNLNEKIDSVVDWLHSIRLEAKFDSREFDRKRREIQHIAEPLSEKLYKMAEQDKKSMRKQRSRRGGRR